MGGGPQRDIAVATRAGEIDITARPFLAKHVEFRAVDRVPLAPEPLDDPEAHRPKVRSAESFRATDARDCPSRYSSAM